jgi:methoxymalonate biosynthesis protein
MVADVAAPRARSDPVGGLKCLVWDLDGTVWSGSLLDGDEPRLRPGAREVVAELDARGVLQSVASANLHEHAWPWLERFGLAQYLVAPEIGLGDKHESVARVARRLRLRLQDLAFVDDDPLERALVRSLLPDVTVIDAADYRLIPGDPRFNPAVVSREGRQRRHLVQAELRRDEEAAAHPTLADFLRSASIHFRGRPATAADLPRVLELSARANRMNATASSRGRDDLAAVLAAPDRELLVASLHDRFGDYGTVAAAVLACTGPDADVDGLWMSCRAGRRGLPGAFFTFLARRAHAAGASRLSVRYRRSVDNRLAAFHLGTYGFTLAAGGGSQSYELPLPSGIRPYEEWMEVSG